MNESAYRRLKEIPGALITKSLAEETEEELNGLGEEINEEDARQKLGICYEGIIRILKKYLDLPEDYYPIISLWIIGTYLHDNFETFPLLFINATKGSGKSRLLKLIQSLSWNGKIVLDLREAVLFRTAKNGTICIDEFEGVGKKENGTLRTLINASYKKGTAVERMKKVTKQGQEEQVVERFDLYTPVVMANIWGMDDVVADRCINVILEKSSDPSRVKLIEDFDRNPFIKSIRAQLNELQCSLCSVVTKKNIVNAWNVYVEDKYITTLTTFNTYNTETTQTTPNLDNLDLFNKIDNTGIDGRNLELFFPLFIVSRVISEELFDNILNLSKKIVTSKKTEEYAESKDVSLVDFISKQEEWRGQFISIHDILKTFKLVASEDPEEERWLNTRWTGRALTRSKLIISKRRLGKGVEVMLDIDKAKVQLKRYKEVIEVSKNDS